MKLTVGGPEENVVFIREQYYASAISFSIRISYLVDRLISEKWYNARKKNDIFEDGEFFVTQIICIIFHILWIFPKKKVNMYIENY